jgi:sortase A
VRRRIQIVGWTLIWSGLFILGYVGYELFITDLLNARTQAAAEEQLQDSFEEARVSLPPIEAVDTGPDEGPESVEYHPDVEPVEGSEFAVLRVPRLGLEVVLFEGVGTDTLKKGPGHMPGTPLPGQPGNAVISGHRTTYGRPFFNLDQLRVGDIIEVESAIGVHTYRLNEEPFVVAPTDVWVTDDKVGGWLTLTTCNPKFSARQRLIVDAELVDGPNLAYIRLLEGRSSELN